MKITLTPSTCLMEHITFCFTSLPDLQETLIKMGWYDEAAQVREIREKMGKLSLKEMEEIQNRMLPIPNNWIAK